MNKKDALSLMNAIRSIVSDDRDTTSSVQTVADKDISNMLRVVNCQKVKMRVIDQDEGCPERLPKQTY